MGYSHCLAHEYCTDCPMWLTDYKECVFGDCGPNYDVASSLLEDMTKTKEDFIL